jgi:hypothetical protein
MENDNQSKVLFGETLAIQAALSAVLYELHLLDPIIAGAIARGFDNAAIQIENLALQAEKSVPLEHFVKALGIIERLRTASLGHQRTRNNEPS